MIKKLILILIALMLLPVAMSAQKPSERERNEWMKEMQQYKNDYIARKLDLSEEQKAKFLPVYNRMEDEVRKLCDRTFAKERDVRKKGDAAVDKDYEDVADEMYEMKYKEGQIELRYYKEFKKLLTPRQLLNLKKAERDFSRDLMKKHREKKSAAKPSGRKNRK